MSPRLSLREISFFERPVRFARPFRFGAVVLNAASQVFVRAKVDIEGRGSSTGASAELPFTSPGVTRRHRATTARLHGFAATSAQR